MSCCPATAWGGLSNPAYSEKGQVDKVDDLEIYRVGSGPNCIIWNYDIFGFNGGRSRQLCDFFADHGYLVIMPDYYRGTFCDVTKHEFPVIKKFLQDHSRWNDVLKADWENKVKPYAEEHGAKTYLTVGCCWGSYMVVRLASFVDFKAGVGFHPSHSPIMGMLEEDEKEIIKEVKCPLTLMPANGDHENSCIGGLDQQVMGNALDIIPFPDMAHGWTTRGDLKDPAVERDVKKACNMALAFFQQYRV